MTKCYCASPFFNKKERRIRDLMVDDLYKLYSEFNPKILRPDLTEESSKFDINPSQETATKLLKRNLDDIEQASWLIFPRYTNDLGTLFEVGRALRLGKVILRYDYTTGKFDVLGSIKLAELNDKVIVDLGVASSAIVLGYNYGKKLGYYLPTGVNDNIMLLSFRRFDNINNFGYNIDKTLVEVNVKLKYGKTKSGEKCIREVSMAYTGLVPNNVSFTNNCSEDDYLVCFSGNKDPILSKISRFNLDDILGLGESVKKLYTGVS